MQEVTVDRPAPGTPPDTLYTLPTAPSAARPYSYAVANANYPLPLTVFRPFFDSIGRRSTQEATPLQFTVNAKTPAAGVALTYSASNLPSGAVFDPASRTFSWTPRYGQAGTYQPRFIVNDGVLPESVVVAVTVTSRLLGDVNGDGSVGCTDMTLASGSIGKRTGQADSCPRPMSMATASSIFATSRPSPNDCRRNEMLSGGKTSIAMSLMRQVAPPRAVAKHVRAMRSAYPFETAGNSPMRRRSRNRIVSIGPDELRVVDEIG